MANSFMFNNRHELKHIYKWLITCQFRLMEHVTFLLGLLDKVYCVLMFLVCLRFSYYILSICSSHLVNNSTTGSIKCEDDLVIVNQVTFYYLLLIEMSCPKAFSQIFEHKIFLFLVSECYSLLLLHYVLAAYSNATRKA